MFKRTTFMALLLVTTLVVGNSNATTTEILPDSSHYQGRSHYSIFTGEGTLSGRIDFAVYDTEGSNGDEFSNDDTGFAPAPGTGQYIYAYQIFSDQDSTALVDFFAIFGFDESSIHEPLNDNIGSVDDLTGESIQPDDPAYFTSSSSVGTMGVWEFANGLIAAGEHSWFLVLRSDQDWTPGSYTFNKTLADTTPVPVPEPTALALLGLGGVLLSTRRRKSS